MSMKEFIGKCLAGDSLTTDEAASALDLILTNNASDAQIAGLLVALRAKGETVDEIVGFARTMRQHAVMIRPADADAIDMCGTGGDGLGTFNISTVATFVAAGAGVTVAKHGNRAVSSPSGSADVLEALGVKVQLPPDKIESCLNTVGVGFLFAPLFHPAMRFVSKTRAELGVRTIFNILGPITNPAGVKRQLIGTYGRAVASRLAEALAHLDTCRACVVHSNDGMDEVSLSTNTVVFDVNGDQSVRSYVVSAEQFGLRSLSGASLKGGSSVENAATALRILNGERSPQRDVVIANAAFGIHVSGKAVSLDQAARMAEESIDSRRALHVLEQLVEFTNRP